MNATMQTTASEMVLSERLELERVIERGKQSFFEVGSALCEIRDRRGYKPEHKSFTEYCQKRWGWSRMGAAYYIDAAKVVSLLPAEMSSQLDVTHAAELARLVKPHNGNGDENGDGRKKEIDIDAIKQLAETVDLSRSTVRQLRRAVGIKKRDDARAKRIAAISVNTISNWDALAAIKRKPTDYLLRCTDRPLLLLRLKELSKQAKYRDIPKQVTEIQGAVELLNKMYDEIESAVRDANKRVARALKEARAQAEQIAESCTAPEATKQG